MPSISDKSVLDSINSQLVRIGQDTQQVPVISERLVRVEEAMQYTKNRFEAIEIDIHELQQGLNKTQNDVTAIKTQCKSHASTSSAKIQGRYGTMASTIGVVGAIIVALISLLAQCHSSNVSAEPDTHIASENTDSVPNP